MAKSKRSVEKEQFWRLVLEEHQRSGLSVRRFCQREGVSEPSFYAWRREIRQRDAERADEATGASKGPRRLVPVNVIGPVSNAPPVDQPVTKPLEIVAPGGWKLRCDPNVDPDRIGALLDVIGRQQNRAASC